MVYLYLPHSDATGNDFEENVTDEEESRTNAETNQISDISTVNVRVNKRWRTKRLNRTIDEHHRVGKRRAATNDFTVNNVKNDPLFHFFMSMYETTKRLPPISQHAIKTSVFACVSREESKNLAQNSPHSHSSNTPGFYVSTSSPVQHQGYDSLQSETVLVKQETPELIAEECDNMFPYSAEPFN